MDPFDHEEGSGPPRGGDDGSGRPFRLPPSSDAREGFIPDAFGAAPSDHHAGFEWRDTYRILQRRRRPAMLVLALAVLAAILHASTRVPTYEAKVRLVIEPPPPNVTGLKDPIDDDRLT